MWLAPCVGLGEQQKLTFREVCVARGRACVNALVCVYVCLCVHVCTHGIPISVHGQNEAQTLNPTGPLL